MLSGVKEFFSGELTVSTNSWHYRWYSYWLRKGGLIPYSYQENLCHYWRVLLFWAPIRWFFFARKNIYLRPWSVTLAGLVLLGYVLAVYLAPAEVIGITILFGAAVGIDLGFIKFVDYLVKNWGHLPKPLEIFFALMIAIGKGIAKVCLIFWRGLFKPYLVPSFRWLDRTHFGRLSMAHWLVIVLASTALGIVFIVDWETTLGVILTILVLALILAAIVGMIVGLVYGIIWWNRYRLRRRWSKARSFQPSRVERVWGGMQSTTKVAGHVVLAKKRRICPFIKFEIPKTVLD